MSDLFFEAAKVVSAAGHGTVGLLMKELGVDYYEGADLIKELQKEGILGPYPEGSWATLELLRPIGFY